METSERQPFVVGVVIVVMVVSESSHAPPSNTLLGRERVSRFSVDSRGCCTRVLVVAVVTNSSASVAGRHRRVHLLLHDHRLIGNCLHIVLRVFTLSCESFRVVRNLYPVTDQIWLNSRVIDVLRHVRPLLPTSTR